MGAEERRRGKRLELTGEIALKELGSTGGETVEITITDASTVGMGFSTQKQLTVGDNYEASLVLWNKDKIEVFVQIVRAEKIGDLYHYGGVFIGMPEDVKMRIQVYETVEDEIEKTHHSE